jgi:hypothetical protein
MSLVVEWVMRRRHMVFLFLRRQITAALMKSANSKWGQSWKILFSYFEFWLLSYSRWSARCQGWDHEMDVLSWMCTMRQWEILDVQLQLKLWCSRIWDHFWSTEINAFQLIISLSQMLHWNINLVACSDPTLYELLGDGDGFSPGNEEKLSVAIL